MPDTDSDGAQTTVDLPAVYSQGGFVQVRTIILSSNKPGLTLASVANDQEDTVQVLPAS
jgi:hypothetical protein